MAFTIIAFVQRDKNNEESLISLYAIDPHMPPTSADDDRVKFLYHNAQKVFPDVDFRILEFNERKDVTEEWLLKFGETITSINPDGTTKTTRIWKAPDQLRD